MVNGVDASIEQGGVLRRLGAFLVDSLILLLIGFIAGFFLYDQFVALGPLGVILGFFISAIYFTCFHSHIGGGQTLGKQLLGICVLKNHGDLLSVPEAFVRFSVLGVFMFFAPTTILYLWLFSVDAAMILQIASLLIVSLSVYMVVFNRKTGQTIHDLVVGSYVVKNNSPLPQNVGGVWGWHFPIGIAISATLLLAPQIYMFNYHQIPYSRNYELQAAAQQLNENLFNEYVGLRNHKYYSKEGNFSTAIISVQQWERKSNEEYNKRALGLVRKLITIDPKTIKHDKIMVLISYGYNIGIAKVQYHRKYVWPAADWKRESGNLSE